jgi:ATP-dependent DNA helicase RecQ
LLGFFANQVVDAAERERAWQRYHTIRGFVESNRCRHSQICVHFGETPKWTSCGACDVCGISPAWLSGPSVRPARSRTKADKGATYVGKEFGSRPMPNQPLVQKTGTPLAGVDPELREYLREWRRITAKEQSMPAYVVLHDASLDEICRRRPSSVAELLSVSGIGERKADMYGVEILAALKRFVEGARASAIPGKKTAPAEETLRLLGAGKSFEEIATIRGRQLATVVNAVANLVEKGELEFQPVWIDRNRQSVIEAACASLGLERLRNLKDALPPEITFEEIRLVVARLRREQSQKGDTISA